MGRVRKSGQVKQVEVSPRKSDRLHGSEETGDVEVGERCIAGYLGLRFQVAQLEAMIRSSVRPREAGLSRAEVNANEMGGHETKSWSA